MQGQFLKFSFGPGALLKVRSINFCLFSQLLMMRMWCFLGQIMLRWAEMNVPPEFNPAHAELHRMFTKKMRRPKKPKENPDDESEESDLDEIPDDDEDEYEDEDVRLIIFSA